MPSPRGSWFPVDLSIRCDEADLADNDVVVIGGIVPFAGTIKEVWAGIGTALPTTGTLAVAKAATADVNVLTAATVDLTALTVNVAAKQTVATTATSLRVTAGTILEATWTLTNITVGDDSPFVCLVMVEPDIW